MKLCFYISGHGFGHASRTTQVVNELTKREPRCTIVIRTMAPRWFLEAGLLATPEVVPVETDVGVAQADSLSVDPAETARQARLFYSTFEERVARESATLRSLGVRLVVGDVPPLAFAAAAEAGIPSIAIANFTWDWIYAAYPEFETDAREVVSRIGEAYRRATLALRLPFAGGFDTFRRVEDIPLIARAAPLGRSEARRRLEIGAGAPPVVLGSFGGHGVTLPVNVALRDGTFTLMLTTRESDAAQGAVEGLRILTAAELSARGLTYPDLVAAADVVLSKSGYGIVSECIANHTPLLYASRGHFVEHRLFVRDLPRVLRCREIGRDALLEGDWSDAVAALLAQPAPPETMRIDGARVAAESVLAHLGV